MPFDPKHPSPGGNKGEYDVYTLAPPTGPGDGKAFEAGKHYISVWLVS